MKLLKFKMEIKGSLSDFNLGGIFFWSCSESISSYSLTSSFLVFRYESYPLLDFSFALFGNPFEPSINLDLEFFMDLMENPYCFEVIHSPLNIHPSANLNSPFPSLCPLTKFPLQNLPSGHVNSPYLCFKPLFKINIGSINKYLFIYIKAQNLISSKLYN